MIEIGEERNFYRGGKCMQEPCIAVGVSLLILGYPFFLCVCVCVFYPCEFVRVSDYNKFAHTLKSLLLTIHLFNNQ